MLIKKLTLATALIACGITAAQADPAFIATAGIGALQVQGFGLSSTAPALSVSGGVSGRDGGFGLSASATVTGNLSASAPHAQGGASVNSVTSALYRSGAPIGIGSVATGIGAKQLAPQALRNTAPQAVQQAPGLSGRYISAQLQATYSYLPTERLTLQPVIEYGYDGFRGALATQHAAYGLGVGYMLTPTVGVSAQVLHGRTTAGGANGETGQYQSASLYLLAAAPFDLPGNLSLSYTQRRWFAAAGLNGDNYMRTRQLMLSYTRVF